MNTETNTKTNEHAELKAQILEYSRQKNIRPLTPWLDRELDRQIEKGRYPTVDKLKRIGERIVRDLETYRKEHSIHNAVIGMSGGLDSALTAALCKKAGWNVIGVTLPIHQNPEETERGVEAIKALGLQELHVDLSVAYDAMLGMMGDDTLPNEETHEARVRRGNLRARLRMITLYNLASKNKSLVLSTDNIDERANNFFSLNGDVGDLCPIQSLTKAWEVPMLAKILGVPEKTVRATPTDGLGIAAGDEAQFGYSYLESDLLMFALMDTISEVGYDIDEVVACLNFDDETSIVFDKVYTRMKTGAFKRHWPAMIEHPLEDRYGMLDEMDKCIAPHVVPASKQKPKFSM